MKFASGKYKYTKNHRTEHREKMEEILGRKLNVDEVVHHVNGIKSDNRPENLMILSQKEHNRIHKLIVDPIPKKCLWCNKDFFRPERRSTQWWNNAIFCSYKCRGNFTKGKPKGGYIYAFC